MIKHVKESLGQYNDWKFFSILEAKKEEPVNEKKMKSDEEKEGLDVIKKLQDNLERFKSAAGDKIIKYKEFWKENQETKDKFDEGGSLYKLFDSDYVVGVLNLPDEALSEEEINAQIEAVDKEKEGEEKEEGEEHEESETPEEKEEPEEDEEKKEIKESLKEGLDLDLKKPEEEEKEAFDQPELGGEETTEFTEPEGEVAPEGEIAPEEELGSEVVPEGEEVVDGEETPEDEDFESKPETKEFFAVFDMSGSEREEVYRTDNPSVIKQFTDFFENSFKSSMKEQIAKFKQAQEDKHAEAENKAKEKQREERKGKLDNFLRKA